MYHLCATSSYDRGRSQVLRCVCDCKGILGATDAWLTSGVLQECVDVLTFSTYQARHLFRQGPDASPLHSQIDTLAGYF